MEQGEIDFTISFTDITMAETDGDYDRVKELMEEDMTTDWMVRTNCTIDSQFGVAQFVLHFYHDKKVCIVGYSPSVGDVFYNPDLRVLSAWCQESGWRIPEPSDELVRSSIEYWKHFWSTRLVDSSLLDKIYGSPDGYVENE